MILRKAIRLILSRCISCLPFLPKARLPEFHETSILTQLEQFPFIHVVPYAIDRQSFGKFCNKYNFLLKAKRDRNEKSLEYFISLDLLKLKPEDVCIDIASQRSPFPEIVKQGVGCMVYRQDLAYETNLEDHLIGGNAASLKVEDQFCSALTLHCSFEHFEEEWDSGFISEAQRILKPGGRVCILPFYLKNQYYVITDPLVNNISQKQYPDMQIYKTYGSFVGFARHYDVTHAIHRLLFNPTSWNITIYNVRNAGDIGDNTYIKFILLLEKK